MARIRAIRTAGATSLSLFAPRGGASPVLDDVLDAAQDALLGAPPAADHRELRRLLERVIADA